MPDPTDEALARTMVKMHGDTLDWLQSQADSSYADLAYTLERLAWWSAKLFSLTHQQITGAAR